MSISSNEERLILVAMSSLIKRFVNYFPLFNWLLTNLKQWSGPDYVDNLLKTVTGGFSSTAAMGKGVTEDQFKSKL